MAWPFGTIFAIQITKNHIAKNMTLYPKLILDALATVTYAGTKKNLVESDMVADNIRIDGMSVSFSLISRETPTRFLSQRSRPPRPPYTTT